MSVNPPPEFVPPQGAQRAKTIAVAIANTYYADNLEDLIGAIEGIIASACSICSESTAEALGKADDVHARIRAMVLTARGGN